MVVPARSEMMRLESLRRRFRLVMPRNADELHGYCRLVLGVDLPRAARLEGMDAPFDYVRHAFFEPATNDGAEGRDCVVWASRGGGKTRLGAIATLLDLVFKPGIQIRILGGSLDQSSRMFEYLRGFMSGETFSDLVEGRATGRVIRMRNGSMVEVLAQSQQAVRGQRVQKLRCDEVDLFDPDVWRAAQFVTRSARCGDVNVAGTLEAFSTMHRPFGLMADLVEGRDPRSRRAPDGRRVFQWSVLDVLENCPVTERDCASCSLAVDCDGRARSGVGYFAVEDAVRHKARSSPDMWLSEMMCVRPSRSDCVYPEFDPPVHVTEVAPVGCRDAETLLVAGMDFGYRSPTVVLWADVVCRPGDSRRHIHVIDEHVAAGLTMDAHLNEIRSRPWSHPTWIGIDPAGHQRHEHTGLSNAAILSRAGYRIRARRTPVLAGIEAVRSRLRAADGAITLSIHPRCRELIESLRRYHYAPSRMGDHDPVKDGPDHACDALRYLVVNLDQPREMPVRVVRYA